MEVDLKSCKQCQEALNLKKALTKGTVVFSGYCGKSITIMPNGRQKFSDDVDCPQCPKFIDPVKYAERSLKN